MGKSQEEEEKAVKCGYWNIYITVSSSHQTEVFLTYTLTCSSKLSDSAYRSRIAKNLTGKTSKVS